MAERSPAQQPWLVFIGLIVLVAALYLARDVLVPVVLAILITFVLSTPVTWLERRVGRVPAVLGVRGAGQPQADLQSPSYIASARFRSSIVSGFTR